MTTVPPAVARARFAAFVSRALREARSRGMTDTDIKAATGIPPSTFHRWQTTEGGLPRWEKVAAFCAGLDIPTSAAAAALGISDRTREPEPEPTEDPDLRRLGRILRDPAVPESEKQAIRHTIRMLSRATRTEAGD
ncbi:helix-turn-helix transcriptional regulator [Micromonospora sp. C41]|uniref:helix-turn-helix domain-containing protein n=1 Tax=Micromonospora sp. C41 TaxID=2824878 RepID=UPI001FFC758F|nr:helix-turn-helix transcriptional regulator [Micromonospora sp. C41]